MTPSAVLLRRGPSIPSSEEQLLHAEGHAALHNDVSRCWTRGAPAAHTR
jgi:hypothetical protein